MLAILLIKAEYGSSKKQESSSLIHSKTWSVLHPVNISEWLFCHPPFPLHSCFCLAFPLRQTRSPIWWCNEQVRSKQFAKETERPKHTNKREHTLKGIYYKRKTQKTTDNWVEVRVLVLKGSVMLAMWDAKQILLVPMRKVDTGTASRIKNRW